MSKKKQHRQPDVPEEVLKLWNSLKKPSKPKEVWQGQFDGEQDALERIASADLGDEVSEGDLCAYALDLTYQRLQKNLLLHAMSLCLNQWHRNLFNNVDSGFTESFHHALARSIDSISVTAGDRAMKTCLDFMRDSILKRMSATSEVYQRGRTAPHFWIHHLASFGTFAEVDGFLNEWATLPSTGLAICFIQYLSLFMYDEKDNPVFAPFDRKLGGGPPQPWDYESNGFDEAWSTENVTSFSEWLKYDHLRELADTCATMLADHPQFARMKRVIDELEESRDRVELRVLDLLGFLSKPSAAYLNAWSV